MSIEMLTAFGAIVISFGGAVLNFYKIKDAQKIWEHEQKISIEKTLLFKRLEKRYALYSKVFKLLGTVRDIEYPKQHHIDIENNKQQVVETADLLLEELYSEAGLFMEYETRSTILKTYQTSHRYANDEAPLSELIDSYYKARRHLRKDLEFDDSRDAKSSKDILLNKKAEELKEKDKEKNARWVKANKIARSSRPGYPSKAVSSSTMDETVKRWKDLGIKSIICLLSNEEINIYYEKIGGDLIGFYKNNGFDVFHISIPDYQNPPVAEEDLKLISSEYAQLKQPLLVHCGAGQDRTSKVIELLISKQD